MEWFINRLKKKKIISEPSNQHNKDLIEPYIGPRPFGNNDIDKKRFFGRDSEADEIVSLILGHRLILVYAQSGAGKTSIINAKVAPMLEDYGFQVLPSARIGNVSNIKEHLSSNTNIRPSNNKNVYMYNAIQSLIREKVNSSLLLDKPELSDFLKSYYPISNDDLTGQPKSQVLVFDQIEELFTYYPNDRWREDQKDFFQQIAKALKNNTFLHIVFVIREDYLAELDPFIETLPERLRPRFRLERLRKGNALLAIKKPLEEMNSTVYESFKKEIDTDISKIMDDLLNIKSIDPFSGKIRTMKGQFIEPIHLQIVCQRWWQKQLSKENKNFSSDDNILTNVDEALKELYESTIHKAVASDISEEKIRKWCENRLITPNGTRGLVYLTHKSKEDGIPSSVIDILESKYLIRAEMRSGSKWYELTHDRLIGPIKSSNQNWEEDRNRKKKSRNIRLIIPIIFAIAIVIIIYPIMFPGGYEEVNSFKDIKMDNKPFILTVNSVNGDIYLSNRESDTLTILNGKTNQKDRDIPIGNEPADIEVDPDKNILYVTHPSDGNISVINLKKINVKEYKPINIIQTRLSPLYIALNSIDSKLYVSNFIQNTVSVINLDLQQYGRSVVHLEEKNYSIKNITVGRGPTEIEFNSDLNVIYVINSKDNTVSVINGTTNKVNSTIKVGKEPARIEVNPDENMIYVTNYGSNSVSVINGTTNKVNSTIKVGKEPVDIEVNPDENMIYVTNYGSNSVSVINGSSNMVVGILNVDEKPSNVEINFKVKRLYVSNSEGSINIKVIDLNDKLSTKILSHIPTGIHPNEIVSGYANNNKTTMLYVTNTDSNSVSVIDGTTNLLKKSVPVGQKPNDIIFNKKTRELYVSNSLSNTLSVMDTNTETVKYTINSTGKNPQGLGIDYNKNLIYVANTDSNSVSVINGTTREVINKNIIVENKPVGIAVDLKHDLIYVTNSGSNSVSVIDATTREVIGHIPIKTSLIQGKGPVNIVLDSNSRLAYLSALSSNNLFILNLDAIKKYIDADAFKNNMEYYIKPPKANFSNPHGIALNPENNLMYVTNTKDNVIDISSIY
jgi:YVTN family beta-propeller protein